MSPFTSKYDSVQAEKEQFTAQEKLSTSYFAARRCNECHRDSGPRRGAAVYGFYGQQSGLAPKFDAKFQVPTLRNVDMRPRPEFVKAYMHNGYFKSLKEVVHLYNTRDVLPRRVAGNPGEKITCWPAPGLN